VSPYRALVLAGLTACAGDEPTTGPSVDAAVDSAPLPAVVAVTCPASPAATVRTVDGTDLYMPMSTSIAAGGIVQFVMSSLHDVAPNPLTTSDPAIVVGYGQTKCLQFNKPGTYGFYCTPHGFAGTVTVQ
jgi:plastocyanin